MARQAAQPLERVRLLESERDARLQAEVSARTTQALRTISDRLSVAATPGDVAQVLIDAARGALAADNIVVYAVDEPHEQAQLLAAAGFADEVLERWHTMPLRVPTPVTDVIASGMPLSLTSPEAIIGRYPWTEENMRRTGTRASFSYPLASGSRVLGALHFSFATPVVLDADAEAMVLAIARQGGQALDRSRLYENELRARTRTQRLQALTAVLSASLTPEDVAATFLDEAVGGIGADGACLAVVDGERSAVNALAWRGYPEEAGEPWLTAPVSAPPARRGGAVYYEGLEQLHESLPELVPTLEQLGHESVAIVPLRAGSASIGLAFLTWAGPLELDADDRGFLEACAAQCALALDRATRYEAERTIAETLQRSVMPETVPSLEGVQVAARYLPGTSAADVGGDWFDTLALPDGKLGFVVGDVVGKGIQAASTMAQLRNGLRALTLDEARPGRAVTKLNRLLESITDAPFATLSYLVLDPRTLEVTLVSAGHLPPLVVDPAGHVTFLEGGRGLPLGVDAEIRYDGWQTTLAAGSIVVLYTDGLVERREASIDAGLARLADAAARADRDPETFVDALVAELIGADSRADDVAVLALRLAEAPLGGLELSLRPDPESLTILRTELERWLERGAIPAGDARDVVLAAWEAGANAIEHSGAGDELVRVRASLLGDRVRVEVADRGRWKEPQPREERGLGLRLIQSLMTDVGIERTEAGTSVTMERTLTPQPATSGAGDGRHD
jgi:serine/threonine-protein kinase RsbW